MRKGTGFDSGRQRWAVWGAFYLFLLSAIPVWPEAPLRILSWNVRNYLSQDQVIEGGWRPDYPKPEAEKAALRQVLLEADADVVLLQEMGPRPFLRELQRDLRILGLDYPYAELGRGVDDIRHLAVLSRIPWSGIHWHATPEEARRDGTVPLRRGLMEVVFGKDRGTVRIFNVHLKSRYTVDPSDPLAQDRRSGEVQRLIEVVGNRRNGDETLLVAGDFNEPPDFPARSELRARLDELRRLPARDREGDAWTFYWAREDRRERIDAIYLWPAEDRAQWWARTEVEIVDTPAVLEASDHRPLILEKPAY